MKPAPLRLHAAVHDVIAVAGVASLLARHAVVLELGSGKPGWIINLQAAPVGLHKVAGQAETSLFRSLHVLLITECRPGISAPGYGMTEGPALSVWQPKQT